MIPILLTNVKTHLQKEGEFARCMSLLGGSFHYLWLQVCKFAGVCSTCYVEGGHIANAVVMKTASDLQVEHILPKKFFQNSIS